MPAKPSANWVSCEFLKAVFGLFVWNWLEKRNQRLSDSSGGKNPNCHQGYRPQGCRVGPEQESLPRPSRNATSANNCMVAQFSLSREHLDLPAPQKQKLKKKDEGVISKRRRTEKRSTRKMCATRNPFLKTSHSELTPQLSSWVGCHESRLFFIRRPLAF